MEGSSILETCSDQSFNKTELAVGNHLIHVREGCSVHYGEKVLPGSSRKETLKLNNTFETFKSFHINSIIEEQSRLFTEKFENKTDEEFDFWAEKVLHNAILEKEELAAIIEENKDEIDDMLKLIEENEEEMKKLIEKNEEQTKKNLAQMNAWRYTESKNDLHLSITIVACILGSVAIAMFSLWLILRSNKSGGK